jgi:Fe-S-cluster containining protein
MSKNDHAQVGSKMDPQICATCARESVTCCTLGSEATDTCFPLSRVEIESIRAFWPEKQGWFERAENSSTFRKHLFRLFPGEKKRVDELFPAKGTHNRLAVTAQGNCQFLSSTGCALPRSIRPVFCRLYPFWVVWSKTTFFQAANCLAVQRRPTLLAVLEVLQVQEKDIHALYDELRIKWGLEKRS